MRTRNKLLTRPAHCTETTPRLNGGVSNGRSPISTQVMARPSSVLGDRLAQDGGHLVDIGTTGYERRRHDRDVARGLHVQPAIEQFRLQVGATCPGGLAGFD